MKHKDPENCKIIFGNQMVVLIFSNQMVVYDRAKRRFSGNCGSYQENDHPEVIGGGALNIGQIVEDSGITRQGIAKHLKVLHECGVITLTQMGREQLCEARLDQLDEVVDWVNASRKGWNQRFKKLDKFLAKTKRK